ncbi:MAG: formimidoylglutamate deiminase [Gammaproteobacteria bacterium]|nr:formimidoylglutamate deiminase [Gammaproteobacteria bacterium]
MSTKPKELSFKTALLPTGWVDDVAVCVDASGDISNVASGARNPQNGCLIPGLANLHSHAHQRAMAGLAERSGSNSDSFWAWRKTMYQFLHAMQPHHLRAVAAQLYLEMLIAGYTRVAEFQYLHHQPNGKPYDNVAEMSLATLAAAQELGIGMTSLPVHYQFGGFGGQPVSDQQARFFNEPESFLRIVENVRAASTADLNSNVGVAGHSLRAVDKQSFSQVLSDRADPDGPVHMHVAEQLKEIDDCVAWSGARPVDYCLDHFDVNSQWCLIHATHMSESETQRLAASGAVAGICPTTEANLGDGFFNATPYLQAGGQFGIGSDSHISVSPTEELRWFEYGQRLLHKSRNQLSGGPGRSTGRNLFELAVRGGAQACAHSAGAIEVGKRADFVVLDVDAATLTGRQGDELLDSWIFSGNSNCVADVYVGGQQVISAGRHPQQDQVEQNFRATMRELRGTL